MGQRGVWVKGGYGSKGERGVIMEENGVLRESETPSGDLFDYRDS